jgi:hypothetical protein
MIRSIFLCAYIFASAPSFSGVAQNPGLSDNAVFTALSAASAPTFSPIAGAVTNPTTVTASSTSGCSTHIYFDTNNPPTTQQTTYSVTTGVTLYAYVHGCPGYTDSSISSATYIIVALVGWWPLNEGTGSTAIDASTQGNNGTFTGAQTNCSSSYYQTGYVLTYAGCFGSADYVGMGNLAVMNFDYSNPFTLSAWVKLASGAYTTNIITKEAGASAYPGWALVAGPYASGKNKYFDLFLVNNYSTNMLNMETTNTFNAADSWVHVCTTSSGGTLPADIAIWVNGVSQALTTKQNNLSATIVTTAPVNIGAYNNSVESNGGIEDVRVYSGVASCATIYAAGPQS